MGPSCRSLEVPALCGGAGQPSYRPSAQCAVGERRRRGISVGEPVGVTRFRS